MGRIHEGCLYPDGGQDPHLGRQGLPGNRQGAARHHHHDPPQKIKRTPHADCRAEGAQPQGQLHQDTGGALHRKAQEIRSPCGSVRRDHKRVQRRVQRDHGSCQPGPALGQNRQGPAATGQVGDSH